MRAPNQLSTFIHLTSGVIYLPPHRRLTPHCLSLSPLSLPPLSLRCAAAGCAGQRGLVRRRAARRARSRRRRSPRRRGGGRQARPLPSLAPSAARRGRCRCRRRGTAHVPEEGGGGAVGGEGRRGGRAVRNGAAARQAVLERPQREPAQGLQLKHKHRRRYFYVPSSSDSSPKYRMGQSCRKNKSRIELSNGSMSDCTDDGQADMDGEVGGDERSSGNGRDGRVRKNDVPPWQSATAASVVPLPQAAVRTTTAGSAGDADAPT